METLDTLLCTNFRKNGFYDAEIFVIFVSVTARNDVRPRNICLQVHVQFIIQQSAVYSCHHVARDTHQGYAVHDISILSKSMDAFEAGGTCQATLHLVVITGATFSQTAFRGRVSSFRRNWDRKCVVGSILLVSRSTHSCLYLLEMPFRSYTATCGPPRPGL